MTTPEEVRAMFDSLSDLEKAKTGLIVNTKKNKSWTPIREAVKAYALEKKSFSLRELKEAGIIDEKVTGPDFRKNAVEKIDILYEQKGVLKKKASLYHIHGHSMNITFGESSTFVEPSREAAIYIVNTLLNGSLGRVSVKDRMTKKQFPFKDSKKAMKDFENTLIDEAGKDGWRATGRPFVLLKEE